MGYCVVRNVPGFLPDSEPEVFDSFEEAVDYANALAAEERVILLEAGVDVGQRSFYDPDNKEFMININDGKLGIVIEVIEDTSLGVEIQP
ncbi:MAG: hypothetical protein D6732_17305 [Methanobacteriota archaeon]|nr:MAG: hypothetical protein D6732_17305 [Euryarchaeota archaeon]